MTICSIVLRCKHYFTMYFDQSLLEKILVFGIKFFCQKITPAPKKLMLSHPVNSVYTQSVTIRQQVWVPLRIVLEALIASCLGYMQRARVGVTEKSVTNIFSVTNRGEQTKNKVRICIYCLPQYKRLFTGY